MYMLSSPFALYTLFLHAFMWPWLTKGHRSGSFSHMKLSIIPKIGPKKIINLIFLSLYTAFGAS